MTSPTDQPLNGYSPQTIAAIEHAFEAVWTPLYAHMPTDRDRDQSKELRIALSQTLIELAATGITDPQELRRKALESMALGTR
jgi:hypothetical protein